MSNWRELYDRADYEWVWDEMSRENGCRCVSGTPVGGGAPVWLAPCGYHQVSFFRERPYVGEYATVTPVRMAETAQMSETLTGGFDTGWRIAPRDGGEPLYTWIFSDAGDYADTGVVCDAARDFVWSADRVKVSPGRPWDGA